MQLQKQISCLERKRVSLKKVGGSQVMSAKKEEGIATFNFYQ